MPLLGAHVDSSGGLHLAFERAKAMGAEAIQIHPTPPGFWGSPKLDENRIASFKEAAAKHGHPPFYFHAVYLINLAGDDPTLRQRSESTLTGYLRAADELGIDGVIFHTGSHKGAGFEKTLPTIIGHLQKVLERAVRRDRDDDGEAEGQARRRVLRHMSCLRVGLRRTQRRDREPDHRRARQGRWLEERRRRPLQRLRHRARLEPRPPRQHRRWTDRRRGLSRPAARAAARAPALHPRGTRRWRGTGSPAA